MKKEDSIPFPINEVSSSRVVLLVEMPPNSNRYFQVLFTPEELKKINDTIFNVMPKCQNKDCDHKGPCMMLTLKDDEHYTLSEKIKSSYDKSEIEPYESLTAEETDIQ
jgi:hypothetical protein